MANNASTSTATTGNHALTPTQLSDLQDAVMALDVYLLRSVKALRSNEWNRPGMKQIADYQVRELVVRFFFFFCFIFTYSENSNVYILAESR